MPVICYLLSVICSLFTVHCSLFTVHCSLFTVISYLLCLYQHVNTLLIALARVPLGTSPVLRTVPGAVFDPVPEYVQLCCGQFIKSQRHAFFRISFVNPLPEYAAVEVERRDCISVYHTKIVICAKHAPVGRAFEVDRASRMGRCETVA